MREWRVIQGQQAARIEIDEPDEPEFGDGDGGDEWEVEVTPVEVHVYVPTPNFALAIGFICMAAVAAFFIFGG